MIELPDKENLRPDEVAAYLSVTPRHVRKLLQEGSLKGFKVGSVWRIKRAAVLAFEAENSIPTE